MPSGGSAPPGGRPMSAAELRRQAVRARRLAYELTDLNLQARLVAYAAELDSEAAAKDAAADKARPEKPASLRMAAGAIVLGDVGAGITRPAKVFAPAFSPRTDRLLRDAQAAIEHTAVLRKWRRVF